MGALLLLACAGGADTGAVPAMADVQVVFDRSCAVAGCHGGPEPSTGLDLSAGVARGQLVGVPSAQSDLDRVVPGDADASYLVRKMDGTHLEAGGSGTEMPPGRVLGAADRDLVRAWVDGGAPP